MPGEFSFLVTDFELILRYAYAYLPGIRRVDAVYYDAENEMLRAFTVNPLADQSAIQELFIEGNAGDLEKLRKVKAQFSWFSEDELPISQPRQTKRIQDVFSEINKVVLALRIPNETDGKSDMLFFYLNENLSIFGMGLTNKEMTAEHKEIIAHMVLNNVRSMRQISKDDRLVWQNIREMIRENRYKMEQQNRNMEELKLRYEERLVDSCNYFLSNISASEGRKYVFSNGALKLIKSSAAEYHRIENAIKLAVQLAKNFEMGDGDKSIEITEDFLNFNAANVESNDKSLADTVYEKPFNYLTLLEEAAEKITVAKRPLTAQNLVSVFERPVNPSAITWMVNHNMKAFKHLFNLYPEKWPLIRSQFKPVLRILGPDEDGKRKPYFKKAENSD